MGTIPAILGSPSATDIFVPFAALTADAKPTAWLQGLLTLAYGQQSPSFYPSPPGGGNVVYVDQAYVMLADQKVTPLYAKLGRQFIDFGGLDTSSTIQSTPMLLSLTRETAATVGFTDVMGFSGSVYVFRGISQITDFDTTSVRNYGGSLKYEHTIGCFTWDIGAGFVNNIASALYTSSTFANNSNLGNKNAYVVAVPGLDLHSNIKLAAFDASFKFIDALHAFSVNDVPFTKNGGTTLIGAKPAAWGANLGYTFLTFHCKSRIGIGYQGSRDAIALGTAPGSVARTISGIYGPFYAIGMPKTRAYANYAIDFTRWMNVGLEIDKDWSYDVNNGGTGRNATIVDLQLIAKFPPHKCHQKR